MYSKMFFFCCVCVTSFLKTVAQVELNMVLTECAPVKECNKANVLILPASGVRSENNRKQVFCHAWTSTAQLLPSQVRIPQLQDLVNQHPAVTQFIYNNKAKIACCKQAGTMPLLDLQREKIGVHWTESTWPIIRPLDLHEPKSLIDMFWFIRFTLPCIPFVHDFTYASKKNSCFTSDTTSLKLERNQGQQESLRPSNWLVSSSLNLDNE